MTDGSLKGIVDEGEKNDLGVKITYQNIFDLTKRHVGWLMKHYIRPRNAISKNIIKRQSLDISRLGILFSFYFQLKITKL